jgi:uncharacterized protein involved in exopolysaccharide biosynthesis
MSVIESSRAAVTPFIEITATLSRRKWQVAIIFLTVFASAVIITFLTPRQYETRMKILVKNERMPTSSPEAYYRSEVSEEQINTEIELLNSSDLLREVVEKCGLERLERSRGPFALERAVKRLQHDLRIAAVRKANIITPTHRAAGDRRRPTACCRPGTTGTTRPDRWR